MKTKLSQRADPFQRRAATLPLHIFLLSFFLLPCFTSAQTVANGDVAGLIAAINAANATPGADIINLAPGGTYTLTSVNNSGWWGPTGLPIITSEITINGNGATIERSSAPGTPNFRIFLIAGLSADLTLNEVTIRGGKGFDGAGLLNVDRARLQLVRSTVTGNGGGEGGGILNFNGGQLTVINSTISYNTGFGGRTGGGILNFSTDSYVSKTTINNSTIFENRADGPPGFQGRGDAIADAFSPPGSIIIKNSILASPTNGLGNDFSVAAGVVTSLGHNIVSDASGGLTGTGDLNSTDPLLGPLANNGGPTQTHAPLPGSPAINAVPLANLTDANGNPITTDQRGVARPQGSAGDIGSVEFTAGCVQPPAGMVAWWPLDETSGSTVVKDIINGNNGTPQVGPIGSGGPNATTGMVSGGFYYHNNAANFVIVPNHSSLNFGTGSFTIDAWVNPDTTTPTAIQSIVDKLGGMPGGPITGYRLDIQNAVIRFRVDDGTSTVTATAPIAYGQWQHVAAVGNRTNSILKIYINAVLAGTTPVPSNFGSINNTNPLLLGGTNLGYLDEVELFNRALDSTEIRSIWAAGSLGKCKPTTGVTEESEVPTGFALMQSYPNPFNPTTTIEYHVPVSGVVKLSVFDMLGREIAVLVNGNVQAGKHKVTFDASSFAAGVYFYRMQAGSFSETKKLILLK